MPKFKKFYLFIFLIAIYKLELANFKIMKTKKAKAPNKRGFIERFLSIRWSKEVGDLIFTLNI